jgi:(2Fe-2S) ferredoxin
MDFCAFGPNMMIWPEGLWYMKVTRKNIPQIVQTYMKLEEADKAKEETAAAK